MLQINNFSTLFEIAASLNVAFIAVEYATSYTESVAKNVFKFFDKIQSGIELCKKHIDNETINSLDDVKLNGHSIIPKIQKVKRESEKISKEIDQLSKSLSASVKEKCQLKCFSMVCLHLFLYCLTAAFMAAYEDEASSFVEVFWESFSVLSFAYILSAFYFGEIKDKCVAHFQSIKWNVRIYGIIFILSCILAYIVGDKIAPYLNPIWNLFVSVTAIYPFAFFLFFIWALKHHSKNINEDIRERITALEMKCVGLENEVKKLSTVKELSLEVDCMPSTDLHNVQTQKQVRLEPYKKKWKRK